MKFDEHKDSKVFKGEEMAKVADLKAMFNQDLPVGKPPLASRKPPVAAGKPKVTPKAPGYLNGASKTAHKIPNGLSPKELSSVRLKPADRLTPVSRSPEKPRVDTSQGIVDFRSKLRKVQDTKPIVTPKPGVKPKPKVPSSESSQADSDLKRRHPSTTGSNSSVKSDGSTEESFRLATLPSLDVLGSPPQKPPKPSYVKLPLPTGVSESRSRKPISSQPVLPPKPKHVEPIPKPTLPEEPDFNETYDDVERPAPPVPSTINRPSLKKKRISMIPTMDSDDDEEDADDIYDDGSSAPLTDNGPSVPALPSINTLPVHPHQTSAGSSSSHIQTSGTSENTGSGGDIGEIDGDFDELYEPLDMDHTGSDTANLEKEKEAERKKQEKLKKDQERQQKKDEERRKKEDKEEKKRKEKADKDLKKKFKLKGDWTVLETGTAVQDVADESDKFSVVCSQGDALEIIRKDGPNPSGKWLVRNTLGDPGYIDSSLVRTAEGDFDDEYDAVGLSGDGDFQDVYDIAS